MEEILTERSMRKDEAFAHFIKLQSRALKPGRNEKCPCGSGKKYKKCCLRD